MRSSTGSRASATLRLGSAGLVCWSQLQSEPLDFQAGRLWFGLAFQASASPARSCRTDS